MIFTVCPHCEGLLVPQTDEAVLHFEPYYLYDCAQCSRGFNVFPDGHWEAIGDAGMTKYTKEQVEAAQPQPYGLEQLRAERHKFCRCGREAYWRCNVHDINYCRRCGETDGQYPAHKEHREPLNHKAGTMTEIGHNLWLGDRFDAEEIQYREDKNQWVIFAVGDYLEKEFPKYQQISNAMPYAVKFFSIFGAYRDPVRFPYGSDWHEDPDLQVDMQVMDQLVCEIRDALLSGCKVLVHCVGGIHRSPLVVAYFLWIEGYCDTIDDAYDLICEKRPEVQRRIYWLPDAYRDPPKADDFN